MYVYRTDQVKHKAKQHNLETHINRFCDELLPQSVDQAQAHFKRLYPYLKRKVDHNYRLIARMVRVQGEGAGEDVLVLLDILKRGAKDYEHFLRDREGFGQQYLDLQIQPGELENWLLGQHNLELVPHRVRPLVQENPDLLPWLEPPGWKRENQGALIYESEIWFGELSSAAMRSHASQYTQLVEVIQSPQSTEQTTEWPGVLLYGAGDRYILFSRIVCGDQSSSILFLLCPFSHYPTPEEISAIGDRTYLYNQTVNYLNGHFNLNSITALARRAYPNYLLAHEDWLILEGSPKVNLALSAEEESLLNLVSTPGNHALPLFLNGQAGSGKSTLLFYLFADYCYRKFYYYGDRLLPGNPLFLTYNERLLEVAKDRVQKLLKFHHRFVSQQTNDDPIPNIRHFFKPFQRFLLNLLPPEYTEKFALDRYISFHQFKVLYQHCPLPTAHHYSPERCWHVIRTFIKGYSLEEMTLEDYEFEVPRKERTVPIQEFKDIYTLWQNWYQRKAQESGYWDDQDLIKQVLQLPLDLARYTAIFCDESQDFTRIELQLILRLSIFSRYDLGYQTLENFPFVFAGDPFQTLNPTGFRWDSFKAAFYSEVVIQLDPTRQLGLEMNFQELECNYRSYAPIVKFNNLIQFWRYLLFNHRDLKPQRVWKQGQLLPEKFILEDNLPREVFKEYIQNTIIIIPCEEGGEIAYIQEDEVLSEVIEGWSDGEPPKNVLSAIAAKGLEFKRVILYKFGEACHHRFWTLLEADRPELSIEVEYFFNKLYVAASRAIERLFVVDTPWGDRTLWDQINDPHHVETHWGRVKNLQDWQQRIQFLQTGTDESAKNLQEDDLLSVALTLKTEGLNAQDPKLLRRAKQYYRTIGNLEEGHLCEAWALKFEQQYQRAGSEFWQLGEEEEAWDCFWQGSCWADLYQWYQDVADRPELSDRHSLEQPLINFMVSEFDQEAIQTLTQALQVYHHNQTQILEQHRFSPQWATAIKTYQQNIEEINDESTLQPAIWYNVGEVLQALSDAGYPGLLTSAGLCFYRGKAYQEAVDCFTSAQATEQREYYLAKSQLVGLPEGLEYLKLASSARGSTPTKSHSDLEHLIYQAWNEAGSPKDPAWLRYIAPILENQNSYYHAFMAYLYLDDTEALKRCFDQISDPREQRQVLPLWLQYLIRRESWPELPEVFEQCTRERLTDLVEKTQVLAVVIYELAHSNLHPNRLSIPDRQRYEYLIKDQFLGQSNWQNYLLMEQVGIALEKIGGLGVTLDFYQTFCEGNYPTNTQQLARTRWLATKKKQEDYYTTKGKTNRLIRIRSELAQKSRSWKIPLDTVSATPPSAPQHRPSPPQPQQKNLPPVPEVTNTAPANQSVERSLDKPMTNEQNIDPVEILGLPKEVEVKQISHGVLWFSIKNLVIKVTPMVKQVLIADILSGDRLRVDLINSSLLFKTMSMKGSGNEPLIFSCFNASYEGRLEPGDPAQLFLNIAEHQLCFKFKGR
ncbi:MAG: hypothetical protein J7524_01490 [Roseofilum sp. Belize BBD 4]|uniref:hypothetical protein n=1 Tax=Roseofilum sp. Belize BBD 4 TaxID=2821500 RepID=UPI000E91EEE2|nr:hypothetical protein [Roseofilum sp. Belize BBD 4]MBP0031825.1 hypothetical protein [Roseofilum sp. Belize BBD 4]HBQ98975.1 hypothetical protein [Cyanobacteria bacterium UBA11691]